MTPPPDKIEAARARWALSRLEPIAETATSWVFRTSGGAHAEAVLKILTPHGADEINGAELLAWYDGDGAAKLYDAHDGMMLMEYLDGPPLGDVVRASRDREATTILTDVIGKLHQPRPDTPEMNSLDRQFSPLLGTKPDDWAEQHRGDAARACRLAMEMLATTTTRVPLHGDLHHDNVVGCQRGWLAIDPKGLTGDPAYEVSNVFRNPIGADERVMDPARIGELADAFSQRLGLDRRRILAWAAAHAALSECWDRAAGSPIDLNLALLPLLLAAFDRS